MFASLMSVFAIFFTVLFLMGRMVLGSAPIFFEVFPMFTNFLILAPCESTHIQCFL